MPNFQHSRIWEEKELSEQIKACLLESPSDLIITSSTSNVQREPGCIVLLDHKYPIIGLKEVIVERTRSTSANLARVTLENISIRYSGPNKAKITSNIPVSIYAGYSKNYVQRFEGFVDTTEMTTDGNGSIVQLQCRDKTKKFLTEDVSTGIYAADSDYYGFVDWHYAWKYNNQGVFEKLPRPWLISEIFRDICYHMDLRDITPFIMVAEKYDPATGLTSYERSVEFRPQYRIEINPSDDRYLKCQFLEENALDVVAQLAQSICHEVLFEADGTLVIRPVKTAADPAAFYFKEERDIITLKNAVNDDDVSNVITVVGQTMAESAVTYPFGPVAVAEDVTLDKGQDKFGWTMEYPRLVAPENWASLQHPQLYAHVIAPGGQPVTDYKDNPENSPKYDVRIHYPNFAQPYEKQECLTASCPIITDEAQKANITNIRTWNYYGAVDEAVSYERMPITLRDRFRKYTLVVCKERSMDDSLIVQCGNTPNKPGLSTQTPADPDAEPINIPTVVDGTKFTVDQTGKYVRSDQVNVPVDINVTPNLPTSSYTGIPVPGTLNTAWYLTGYQPLSGTIPNTAIPYMPFGLNQADTAGKSVRIAQFNAYQGISTYQNLVPDWLYDSYATTTLMDNAVMVQCTKDFTTSVYTWTDPNTGQTMSGRFADSPLDPYDYQTLKVVDFSVQPKQQYLTNCKMDNGVLDTLYNPYNSRPSTAVRDPATMVTETCKYPMIFYSVSLGLMNTPDTWTFSPIFDDIQIVLDAINQSRGMSMEIYSANVDPQYIVGGGPDVNCIYWKWKGSLVRKPTPSSATATVQALDPAMAAAGWLVQGKDSEGNERELITRDEFYRLAADPNTTVVELVTAGVDHYSWAEVIKFDEYRLMVKGHNLYGSMKEAWEKLLDALKQLIYVLIGIFAAIAIAFATGIVGMATGAPGGAQVTAAVGGSLLAIIALLIVLYNLDDNLGANVSKVMEDMQAKVTGVRREEIHLWHNAGQAATWFKRDEQQVLMGTMEYASFGYNELSSLWAVYQPNNQNQTTATQGMRDFSWVFIMDLTAAGMIGGDFMPDGPWVTSVGWETPEVGDRNPIEYYTQAQGRKEITTRFAIEAFGDDERDVTYSAERLMGLRFETNPTIGIQPGPAEMWYKSSGYELLVDRSMSEMAVSDTGFWFDFFEKRDNYIDRRYKYVALVIYSFRVKEFDPQGALLNDTQYIQPGTQPDPQVVFAHTDDPVNPGTLIPCRWGLYVPRGLNPQYYEKFRWHEKDPATNISKREQNYTKVTVLWAGQEKLVAHLMNNFRYSVVTIDFRVWGKAYGKYAPTLVYYTERNLLSMGSYGYRETQLVNNCINNAAVARKLATLLTAQANETYTIDTTGKPYVKEGDIVMVKEETSGALAGNFQTWVNNWFAPDMKTCVEPSNQLVFTNIPGVYEPQCAIPTFKNNTLIACSNGTQPCYLVEIDRACNPIWYATTITGGMSQPVFVLRWSGPAGPINSSQVFTYVGMASGMIQKIDYAIANIVTSIMLPWGPHCGTMDEEQLVMFCGTTNGIVAVDLVTDSIMFSAQVGDIQGISSAQWKVYDKLTHNYEYLQYGVVFAVSTAGIFCYQIYADETRTALGPLLASYTGNLPFNNPGSLEYDKSLNELVYVDKATATDPATIHGIRVEVDLDPAYPDAGFVVEFVEVAWALDYMADVELQQSFSNPIARAAYINSFFRPVHAVRDVNKDLLVTDTYHNKVQRLSPDGKFYVDKITDQFTWTNDGVSYRNNINLVTIASAGSLQLTNFGKNFLNTKTEQIVSANMSTSMARVLASLGKDKYLIKLMVSQVVSEAINNTNDVLNVNETVLVMFGYNGDTSGTGTIIGKLSLNDWGLETGEPYVYIDATTLDVTKYGLLVSNSNASGGGGAVDLSAFNAWIRRIEANVRTLGGLHGLKF